MDAILNADGTFTLTFYEPLPFSSNDVIEGVVTRRAKLRYESVHHWSRPIAFSPEAQPPERTAQFGDQIVVTATAPNPFQNHLEGLLIPQAAL